MAKFLSPLNFHGSVEVVCGPMFSGKTEELIRRVRRAQIARVKVQIFKPALDTRYADEDVVSHTQQSVEALPVESSEDILKYINDTTRLVAIDEVQFFDQGVVKVAEKLARRGCAVVCAGLDLDYRGIPFGPMPGLLAIADEVTKLHAVCTICGAPASRSQRITSSEHQVLLGEKDAYQARCRGHYEHSEDLENILIPSPEQTNVQEEQSLQ